MRVLAGAGALAMAGGMIGLMGTAAQAAGPTVLESCQATLLSSVTPPLGASDVSTVIKGADKTTETCTGAAQGQTGNAIGQSAGLTGTLSCPGLAGNDPNVYPANGKMSIKYANLDPNLKNFASSGYIRLGSSQVGLDVLHVTGIVTKGVAVGADVTGDLGFSGWWDSKFTPAWDNATAWAKSALVADSNKLQWKALTANTGINPIETAWSSATAYNPGDKVSVANTPSTGLTTTYKALLANTNKAPATNKTTWEPDWVSVPSAGNTGPIGFNDLVGCVGGVPGDNIPFAKAFTNGTTTALGTVVSSAVTLQFP
jgi:hypothetical protein